MRRLIVMRHAKSAWDTDASSDHLRPLNRRGRQDAPRVARVLAGRGWVPQRVVSSDAARTRETWEHMEAAFDDPVEVEFTPALYHSGLGAVQVAVGRLGAGIHTALVLGHNPGFEDAVAWLSGHDLRLTTGNAVLLVHPDDAGWRDAITTPGTWSIEDVVRPREL